MNHPGMNPPALPGKTCLRSILREKTRDDHRRLDHHPLLGPLVRPGLTREHYGRVLLTFSWIYEHVDARLQMALDQFVGELPFHMSDRRGWLHADLDQLGLLSQSQNSPLHAWTVPPITSPAQLIGHLYVVEGSTLGGQVIARLVHEGIGITPESGGRFFHGHGAKTIEHWESLWTLAGTLVSAGDEPPCAQAASQLFAALNDAFCIVARYWQMPADAPPEFFALN